jgi:multidrug efflux pump subunit AcrA (membrane-fusion protein)
MKPFSSSKWILRSLMGLGAMAAVVALAASLFPGLRDSLANAPAQATEGYGFHRALPVKAIRLNELPAPERMDRYRGTVEASKSASLSFRRSGRLLQLHVREGDRVEVNQLLAILDSRDLQAALRGIDSRIEEAQAVLAEQEAGPRQQSIKAAHAQLRERQSDLDLAQLTLAREENLQKSRASSQQAYDESRMNLERATAATQAAQEQLEELQAGTRKEQIVAQKARIQALQAEREDLLVQLNDCQLLAPFSGVVARRFVDEGIIAVPDRAILKVLQVDPLEARFGLSADDAAKLRPGDPIKLSKGNCVYPATVARIEPELDLATRTQGVIISITTPGTACAVASVADSTPLVPGQTVSLGLSGTPTAEDEFWVPIQALSRSIRGLWSAMAITANGGGWMIKRHDVQVLEIDGGLARIRALTLGSQDWIVAEGLHRITPGLDVEPVASNPISEMDQP